ncbi:ATP-binding cassette domain-containing protein, partial [Brevundimonas sp.]|uniref:cell division ATP-binding protein FtsE n=1 Tax=Brevundimonas sp. TaxID=1871086 RepID=UPI0019B31734
MPSSPASAAETASAPETVRLSGVGFGYADAPGILRDVNLILPRGSFHFLTGPSGAGKSSLLRLLTLGARPQAGRISLFGSDVTDIARRDIPAFRRRMGVVFQDFRLLDHLSAFDNAALPLRLAGGRGARQDADVEEMLKWVGLGRRMDARPPALSGGEKQRLAIARADAPQRRVIVSERENFPTDLYMAQS